MNLLRCKYAALNFTLLERYRVDYTLYTISIPPGAFYLCKHIPRVGRQTEVKQETLFAVAAA